jgi:hypothetical protein
MDEQQVKLLANVKAREAANDWFQLIQCEQCDAPERFWECLRDMCNSKLPQQQVVEESPPMDDLTAKRFENTFMPPKGIHANEQIREVPPDYIEWWINNARDNFTRQLERYAKSERFKERQRIESR